MASSGSTAFLSDYNTPQSTTSNVWRTGSGSRGYGQSVIFSTALTTSTTMGVSEWNNLRYDLFNVRAHQIGTNPAISVAASSGNNVVSTDATNFDSYASTYDTDRLTAHASRISTATTFNGMSSSMVRTTSWTSSVQCEFYQNFASPDIRRYFYNQGGKLRFTSTRTGGAVTAQNLAWATLLTNAGTYTFNATALNGLTSSYSTLYTGSASAPYTTSNYIIEAATSGATVLFRITYVDPYTDPSPGNAPLPEDIIDGTLTLSMDYQYATGGAALAGGGNFIGFGSAYGGNYPLPSYTVIKNMVGG